MMTLGRTMRRRMSVTAMSFNMLRGFFWPPIGEGEREGV